MRRFLLPFAGALLACGAPASIESFEVVANPSGLVPLGALVKVDTDLPTTVSVFADDGVRPPVEVQSGDAATHHEIILVGLRPDREYHLEAVATTARGHESRSAQTVLRTPPLPEDVPPYRVAVSDPERMEPGLTLVPAFRRPAAGNQMDDYGLAAALDENGEIVWYIQTDHSIGHLLPTPDNTFLYQRERNGVMVEIDLLGRTVRRWHTTRIPKDDLPADSIPVDADTFHHDNVLMPSGNHLMLSTEVRTYEDYPSSESDPAAPRKTATVIGDVIIEFTPAGEVVNRWPLLDLLDPRRIGYDSLGTGFYREAYEDVLEEPGHDWSHCNSIDYDPADHAALVSCRPLDVVVKLDLASGELVWLLGTHKGWKEPWQKFLLKPPVDDFVWNFHQHSAKVGPDGRILMFDNGNYRAFPFDPKIPAAQSYSRAVEFQVDQEAGTIAKTWSYGEGDERFFSSFISGTDYLPLTGNILVVDGARTREVEVDGETQRRSWSRVVELTYTDPPEKVFELVLDAPDVGWLIYRAQRLPGLDW